LFLYGGLCDAFSGYPVKQKKVGKIVSFSQISRAIRIFFSYANTIAKDRKLFGELKNHLYTLREQELVVEWQESGMGGNLEQFIEANSNDTNVIVLLISSDFLRISPIEIDRALELGEEKKAYIIPVHLRRALWERIPLLGQYERLPSDGKPVSPRPNREEALYDVANRIFEVVKKLGKSSTASSPAKDHSPLEDIPYRPYPFFTDREVILTTLHDTFTAYRTSEQTCFQALSGSRGVGKTRLAIEYIYKYRREYQTVLWLGADSHGSLSRDIGLQVERLAIVGQDLKDEQLLFAALRRWLQCHEEWLLILDNIDDFKLIDLFVPRQGKGDVLLTTYSNATGDIHAVPVGYMSDSDSALFLLRRAKIIAEKAELDAASEESIRQAKAVGQAVDGLPLALDQAGAYIEEKQCGLARYLVLYRQNMVEMLRMRGEHASDHLESVAGTLSLTFKNLSAESTDALQLLRLLAFLHSDAIPIEMIEHAAPVLDKPLRSLVSNAIRLENTIGILLKYSLIYRHTNPAIVSMSRVNQALLINEIGIHEQRIWAVRVVRLLNHVFPEVNFNNWSICANYFPHAEECVKLIGRYQISHKDAAYLLERLGCYCYLRAYYQDAERYLMYAEEMCQKVLGAEHPHMAQTINTRALLCYKLGRYQEAEKFYQQALAILEKGSEADHDKLARTLNNLALLYKRQRRYQEAMQLLSKIDENAVGRDHPDIAILLTTLAEIYEEQENYVEAERLYRSALAIEEHLLAANHPNLAVSLNNLAGVYEKQGDYQQAEALYQKALTINEQVLGREHVETANVLNNLAYLARQQEQYQKAESLYRRVLTNCEQMLGADHPQTAIVLNNLGRLLHLMKKDEEAEQLLMRGLEIRERVLGPEHLDTAVSLSALAELFAHQHHYERVKPLYGRVLDIYRRVHGPEHSDTVLAQEQYTLLLELIAEQKGL
jgi:tetratricopeptide (TPR) repeat protein